MVQDQGFNWRVHMVDWVKMVKRSTVFDKKKGLQNAIESFWRGCGHQQKPYSALRNSVAHSDISLT